MSLFLKLEVDAMDNFFLSSFLETILIF
jgi:hypothetical protein